MKEKEKDFGFVNQPIGRLGFLKYAGAAVAATGLVMAGCKKKDNNTTTTPTPSTTSDEEKLGAGNPIHLSAGDVGVLQYAYCLEQLEAAFYTSVVASPSFTSIFSTAEQAILNDIKLHEVCHREFFKEALGSNATAVTLQANQVNFNSTINFTDRTSVLNTAKAFEDLGVSAYNGAGRLIVTADYLVLAGKIVSVEARHAAAIRDLITPHSANFAGDDVVNSTTGLDWSNDPKNVMPTANSYLVASAKIDATALPR